MADGLAGEESTGLVQLDRHHLQAFQVIEAQCLLPLDKVVSHRIPRVFCTDPPRAHRSVQTGDWQRNSLGLGERGQDTPILGKVLPISAEVATSAGESRLSLQRPGAR
jgi:hypothetical protein